MTLGYSLGQALLSRAIWHWVTVEITSVKLATAHDDVWNAKTSYTDMCEMQKEVTNRCFICLFTLFFVNIHVYRRII